MASSYTGRSFSANGIEDKIQINLQDDTVQRRNEFHDNTGSFQQQLISGCDSYDDKDLRTAAFMSGESFWSHLNIGWNESLFTMEHSFNDIYGDDRSIDINLAPCSDELTADFDKHETYNIPKVQKDMTKNVKFISELYG